MSLISTTVKSLALGICSACLLPVLAQPANAATIYWTDWTSATPVPLGVRGSAEGSITTPDKPALGVTYNGRIFSATQTDGGGINYWNPSTPYISPIVDNPPPDTDIITLVGGDDSSHTITFDQPVENPVMAIVSMGQTGIPIEYNFDAPFDVISSGEGFWGNGSLAELPGNVLGGEEGHGVIQFQGTFSSINWIVPKGERWHGFTIGIENVASNNNVDVPEPTDILGLLLIGGFGFSRILKGKRQNIA
ncbi:MAG: PEP-CTERM sorting domain-containing protein [Nostocaceae cyanobacterium]|nr:PEP-CTERM sorting domain-containing protein [Nostocaceae cyanobacterium]